MKTERQRHINAIGKEKIDRYLSIRNNLIPLSLSITTLAGIKGYINYYNYVSNDITDSNLSNLGHLCSFVLGLSTVELINSYFKLRNLKGSLD